MNYRPEYRHGWSGKTYYRQLQIDPLAPESVEALLEALLGTDPTLPALKRLLVERAEGNPFFLEESVRALVETRMLVGERGAYRLEKRVSSLQIPATAPPSCRSSIARPNSCARPGCPTEEGVPWSNLDLSGRWMCLSLEAVRRDFQSAGCGQLPLVVTCQLDDLPVRAEEFHRRQVKRVQGANRAREWLERAGENRGRQLDHRHAPE